MKKNGISSSILSDILSRDNGIIVPEQSKGLKEVIELDEVLSRKSDATNKLIKTSFSFK